MLFPTGVLFFGLLPFSQLAVDTSDHSPEWDVKESNVTIQLQPLQSNQLLEVTGNGSLIVDHKTSPESRKEFANTTLRIKTWQKDSHSIININEKDEGDQGTNMTNKIPRPHLTVRSKGGVTHLRLYLSDGVNCENESDILQGFNTVVTYITIVSGIALMCTCVFNIVVYSSAKMTERQTGQNRKEDHQKLGLSLRRLLG
ncbi:uncharacterized protein LOC123505085 isoform X2 [Portunus trituberculatus]|uniref:uncharacterized protein LOC123505085 isoform X2 n=1 Tax=Portunus trituberculatus TaxID=210409 RepID=UPI001E1D0003|nr:uncharacterized protein LOC123505085 isoform X2 [Portunus trituberculatus]